MILPGGACRKITGAAAYAFLFFGCSGQPGSMDSTAATVEAPPAPAAASTPAVVTGRVPAIRGGAPSMVILTPATTRELPSQSEKPVMDQVALSFIPEILFVRTGQPTDFRNSDDVLHNVRVREEATKEGTFNVAIPTGGGYVHTFERDGFYDVGCDIHPGMSAVVIATSTPYTAIADSQGNFTIYDVMPGSYLATIYTSGDEIERPVQVTGGRTEIDLTHVPATTGS